MEPTLNLTTSEKRIPIVRDGVNVGSIVFNPNDVTFAERFYKVMGEFQEKYKEFSQRAKIIDANQALDENDLPVNANERIAFLRDACQYFRERIDILFGVGTSQIVFGDVMELEIFPQFLTGIAPYIQQARVSKVQQYTTPASAKRNKRKR